MCTKIVGYLILIVSLVSVSACGTMSKQDKSTAIGAGVGAVAGSILTDGGTLGTLGGAAIGGMIGHQMGKGDEEKSTKEEQAKKEHNPI